MNPDTSFSSPARLLASAALLTILLSGCSGSRPPSSAGDAASSELSLVESKSPVQLLRNEVASRVPTIVVEGVADLSDISVACGGASDPEGLSRSWLSTATFLVTNSRAASINTVIAGVADSFADQGWKAEKTEETTVLTNSTSIAVISLEALNKNRVEQPAIRITSTGPCVVTDGPDSAEVLALEGRA